MIVVIQTQEQINESNFEVSWEDDDSEASQQDYRIENVEEISLFNSDEEVMKNTASDSGVPDTDEYARLMSNGLRIETKQDGNKNLIHTLEDEKDVKISRSGSSVSIMFYFGDIYSLNVTED